LSQSAPGSARSAGQCGVRSCRGDDLDDGRARLLGESLVDQQVGVGRGLDGAVHAVGRQQCQLVLCVGPAGLLALAGGQDDERFRAEGRGNIRCPLTS
jgi:hypothetical protein